MTPKLNNIIVSVNPNQKDEINIGQNIVKTGKNYNENFREKNPVVAYVIGGVKEIPKGSFIICNYSHFDLESPYHIYENYYSIPVDEEIYAVIDKDGSLIPVCGNVLIEREIKESKIEIPEELKKEHTNRGIISRETFLYKKGTLIFFLPFSNYEIVYQWNGEERRAIKVHENEITGYLKK